VRAVFRYEVPINDQPHSFELTGDPLAVAAGHQGIRAIVEFWAESEDGGPVTTRTFQVFGTGQLLPYGAVWRGTTARLNGLVWHLYELPKEEE
jgi:hypothetical protein